MERKGRTLAPSKPAWDNFQRSSLAEGTVPWLAWWHTEESYRVRRRISQLFKPILLASVKIKPLIALAWSNQNALKLLSRTRKEAGHCSSSSNWSLARLTWQLTPPGCSEEQQHWRQDPAEKKCGSRKLFCKGGNFTRPTGTNEVSAHSTLYTNESTGVEIFLSATGEGNFSTW